MKGFYNITDKVKQSGSLREKEFNCFLTMPHPAALSVQKKFHQ